MRTVIGPAGDQHSASVRSTAFSKAVITRPANGRMGGVTPAPAAYTTPPLSSRSRSLLILPLELLKACETCPQQSEGDAATNRERPDTPYWARHLCFLRRRHDPDRHSPAQPILHVLQLRQLSPERKIRLPWTACFDGQARRPRHRKRQGASLHTRTPHQHPRIRRQRAKNRAVEDRRAACIAGSRTAALCLNSQFQCLLLVTYTG